MPRGTLGAAVLARMLPHTITIRRGPSTFLDPQACRIAAPATTGGADGAVGGGAASRTTVAVYGGPDLDIQRGDMFALEDPSGSTTTYRVQHVTPVLRSPNRVVGAAAAVGVKALAEAQQ